VGEKVDVIPSGRNPSDTTIESIETSVSKYDLAEYHQSSPEIGIPTKGDGTLESKRMTRPIVSDSTVGTEGLKEGRGNVRAPTIEIVYGFGPLEAICLT
jgi:hypothetical protein